VPLEHSDVGEYLLDGGRLRVGQRAHGGEQLERAHGGAGVDRRLVKDKVVVSVRRTGAATRPLVAQCVQMLLELLELGLQFAQ
jgi:hypothetical protein